MHALDQWIQLPQIIRGFELKPNVIALLPHYHSNNLEDPFLHVQDFLSISDSMVLPHVDEDYARLKLFPFYLKDKASHW